MNHFLLFLLLLLWSCKPSTVKMRDDKCLVCGEWRSNIEPGNGNIIFKKDSAYYPFYQKAFAYSIDLDSLWIFFPDKTTNAKFRIAHDTLILFSDGEPDTLWKVK